MNNKKDIATPDQMLARDLSQRDEHKAYLILRSPLFKVATEGAGEFGRYLMKRKTTKGTE